MRLSLIISSVILSIILVHFFDKWRARRATERCDDMLRRALTENHSGFDFNLEAASLLSKKDLLYTKSCIETNRIYKTPEGSYFLYIGTEISPGYFTALSESRAKAALRGDKAAFQKEFPNETL